MVDKFSNAADSVSAQGRWHALIIPDDGDDLPVMPKAIYCHAAGTIVVVDAGGSALPYAMTEGQYLPFRGTRVMATGTTGTYYAWF